MRVPNTVVQTDNGFYHDRPHIVHDSPGIKQDYTVLIGKVVGRFGLSTEVFSGDSFSEALGKAKKSGAVGIERIL
jgi:hypothetical protein